MIAISQMLKEHIPSVARIHGEELPDDFCSLLGPKFLVHVLYPELVRGEESVALCAKEDDRIVGFVVFSRQGASLKKIAFRNFFLLTFLTFQRIFRRGFIRYVFVVVRLLRLKLNTSGYELTYMAVDRAEQGKGIGSKLVKEGFQILTDKKVKRCWVKTLTATPENVSFYERLGFERFHEFLDRVFLQKSLQE